MSLRQINNIQNELTTIIEDSIGGINNALNRKAPIESPTFIGNVSGISKAMVGLDQVDNTSDMNKPVSAATLAAINTLRNSIVNGAPLVLDTLKELADAIGNDQKYMKLLFLLFHLIIVRLFYNIPWIPL